MSSSKLSSSKVPLISYALTSTRYFAHEGYLENDDNYDFGIIELPSKTGLKTGFASVAVPEDSLLLSAHATVTGYPGYKGMYSTLFRRPVYDMYTMSGPITLAKKHKFNYQIDTSVGQSGSGIWWLSEDKTVDCFGVHVTGGSKEEGNGAVRINPENFATIQEWFQDIRIKVVDNNTPDIKKAA